MSESNNQPNENVLQRRYEQWTHTIDSETNENTPIEIE